MKKISKINFERLCIFILFLGIICSFKTAFATDSVKIEKVSNSSSGRIIKVSSNREMVSVKLFLKDNAGNYAQFYIDDSINAKSKKHLEQMMDNIKNLNSKNIKILDEAYEDKVVSKFINLKLASQLVSDNIERPQEIIKILNKYKEKILTISTEYDENEKTIFEKYIPDIDKNILSKFRYLKDGYWDMILKNCFIIDEECVFFDQEWVEENVPVEFLVYRSIVNVEKLRNKIEEYQLYEKMQIKEYIPLFEKLDGKIGAEIMDEKVFSFYQRKHKNPIYDNYILEDKNKKLMSENNKISNQNIELEKKIETELKQNEILNGQIYYLTNENKELKKKLDGIYDSRSWKIVKGISNIKKVIKK